MNVVAEIAVDKRTHFNIGYTIAVVIAMLLFQSWWAVRQQVEMIP